MNSGHKKRNVQCSACQHRQRSQLLLWKVFLELYLVTKEQKDKKIPLYFLTDTTPTSFEEARILFQMLPCKARQNERVVSFSITPVTYYCEDKSLSEIILNKISNQNIEAVSKMIVDFDEIRHYFKLLKEYDFTKRFQDYLLMILDLERRFNEFKTGMESKLQIILPKVCDIKNGLNQWDS